MTSKLSIDLNCDMGEGFGVFDCGADERIMPYITSANIACGFHSSDPLRIRRAVALAARHGVAIGAHPSYPDLVGFGRRAMELTTEEIRCDLTYQVGALWAFCRSAGVPLHHVKPHGALYNKAAESAPVALAVVAAIKRIDPQLILVCLSNSAMVAAAQQESLPYVEEALADRAYTAEGRLVPRSHPGAVLHDPEIVAERAVKMVREKSVTTIDGIDIPLKFETICVHGDTAGSVEILQAMRRRLQESNIAVRAFGR